ncbi:BTB domain-containing protein [Favolaschia claudopus]|uniref:BTB domain-containing protein n=1 Tax=Favolaschia claudopus TaxID=2862362 RepID=A0AAV9ZH32_9AGAR
MSSEPDNTEKTAPAPFVPDKPFDDANADLILTSCDGIDFRVRRSVLTLLSPVFEDMLRLQPPGGDTIPSVTMSESAIVLDPAERSAPGTVHELGQIRYLEGFIDSNPVAVFAISCSHEWKELALRAARASLKFPIRSFNFDSTYPTAADIQLMTTLHYQALLQYHAACSAVSVQFTRSLSLWSSGSEIDKVWCTCSTCPPSTLRMYRTGRGFINARQWMAVYLKAARKVLKRRPLAAMDDSELMVDAFKALAECSTCRSSGFRSLQDFAKTTLTSNIQTAVGKVELKLPF